ncbi:MAG: histidine kinase [Actinomycetota bacterium]|nr:histidine kinase [Actinomycetota bacterium]
MAEAPSAAPGRDERAEARRYTPLLWRVLATNAAVLMAMAVATVLVQSPGTISPPVVVREFPILTGALLVMLAVNLVLIRRSIAPLGRLMELMRRVDPLKPGQRVVLKGRSSEATELAESFNEMLERLETEREESTRRAIAAQESERLRIAQELHDEIGQGLTAALLQLGGTVRRAPPDIREQLGEAQETIRSNLDEVRRIAGGLRPDALDDLGLVSALSGFSGRLADQARLHISRAFERDLPQLTYEQELVVYRVAQEALTNVVRHAAASKAELSLAGDSNRITLRVADDGSGFDGAAIGGGIRGMYERALLIGADLTVEGRSDGGTEVRLEVPVSDDELQCR